jgi:excisionase family DNA binding protein
MNDKKLVPNVAARRLGVTDQHIRRLVRLGKLYGERLRKRDLRIPESALETYRQDQDR